MLYHDAADAVQKTPERGRSRRGNSEALRKKDVTIYKIWRVYRPARSFITSPAMISPATDGTNAMLAGTRFWAFPSGAV